MNKTLIDIFKELENLSFKLDEIDKEIKELVPIMFDDPEESENPIVKEKLNKRELYIEEYNYLLNKAKDFINTEPVSLKCDYFINNFSTTQERLDFINDKLRSETILDGTSELFTSLAYSSIVKSYSPFNIVYVAWKFPQIFNENITIIYDDNNKEPSPEECKKVLLESMGSIYNETEEEIINPEFEGEEEYK